jgi:hypothetical protein
MRDPPCVCLVLDQFAHLRKTKNAAPFRERR